MSENNLNEELVESVKTDVFRQLKVKLTDDDPIFSLAFLHNQLIEEQNKIITKNYQFLVDGFRQVVNETQKENINHFRQIVETCGDIEKEIKEKGDVVKAELTQHTFNVLAGIKKDFDDVATGYKRELDELAKRARPFSTGKAIAVCVACTLFATAGLSGGFWYASNWQKKREVIYFANGYTDMKGIAKKYIEKLPKAEQKAALDEMEKLGNRQRP